MTLKDPTPVHAQKRSKNFVLLAVLVAWVVILFAATLVRIANGH